VCFFRNKTYPRVNMRHKRSMVLRIFRYLFAIGGALFTTIYADAGWLSTPQSILERTDSAWYLNEIYGVERNPFTHGYKFSGGTIMLKRSDDRWVKSGSYSFVSKHMMLVFWEASKVGRLVELRTDTRNYSHNMSWYVQDGEPNPANWTTGKMKCWLWFETLGGEKKP
jgi:hypothetical protein